MADPIFPILKARWKVFTDANAYQSIEKGTTFSPVQRTLHFQTRFLNATVTTRAIGTGYFGRETGIFQIDVMSPEQDREKASRDLGWAVRNHFYPTAAGLWLTAGSVTVRIERPPTVRPTYEDDGYLKTVVEVDWYADL